MTDAACPKCGASWVPGESHRCENATISDRPAKRRPIARSQAAAEAAPEPEADELENIEPDRFVGAMLGDYKVLDRLGAGGMGQVYLVEHVHLKKKFAAKVLTGDGAKKPDAIARFELEAVSASKLEHDNIIDIVNFGKNPDGTVFLVMELLRGETLNHAIARGPFSFADVVRVTIPILRGLAAAHAAGIVHRDLKPENVFLARRSGGRHIVKLLDFGISKMKDEGFSDGRLTQTGQVLGSPLYMSPEASRGALDIDARADLYAIGVMLFEMCTGQVPFRAPNYLQVLYQHINDRPPLPSELRADLPVELERLILRSLDKDRGRRPQSAEELEAELLAAVPGVELDAPFGFEVGDASGGGGTPATDALVAPSRAGSQPVILPQGTPPVGSMTVEGKRPAQPSPAAPAARRSWAVTALGAVVIAGAAIGIYRLATSSSTQRKVVTGDTAAAVPPPPVATAVTSAPQPTAPPATPATVTIAVESKPPGAVVTFDGRLLGRTPLHADVVQDDLTHDLVAVSGGATVAHQIKLTDDQPFRFQFAHDHEKPHEKPRPTPTDEIRENR